MKSEISKSISSLKTPSVDSESLRNTGAPGNLDLQGNIENFKLPDILQLLSQGRKSGTLGIQRDDDIVMVYYENGAITYAYGPRKTSHLGQLLKERNRISASQLSEAVARQNTDTGERRLGQILIEMEAIDRADVIEVVREQVEDLLYSLMSWDSGSFKFYEGQYPTDEEVTVDLSTENIILEGLRRLDEMNHLRDTLPEVDRPLLIAQASAGYDINIELSPEEWNLLALIDGRRTISDIVEISNLSEIESLKKLAALKLAGLINESEIEPTATQGETGRQTNTQLTSSMHRLTGMLEEYLQVGVGAPAKSALRMINGAPLSEIISQSVAEKSQQKPHSRDSRDTQSSENPEDRLWNEFTQ